MQRTRTPLVPPAAAIRFSDPVVTFAQCGNVSVTILHSPLTVEQVRGLRRESTELHQRYGRERVTLAIVEPPAMVAPDDEIRAACAAITRDFPPGLDATVLEGGGFRAAAVRAIMHGFALVSGQRTTRLTFATLDEAVDAIVASGRTPLLARNDLFAVVALARAA